MTSPTPGPSARFRLIKSVEHWCRTMSDNLPSSATAIAAAVAADLFGEPLHVEYVRGTPPSSTHIGPLGQLGLWFALYCEEWGIGKPGATMPSGIMIDPRLLMPLLSLHPETFDPDVHHVAESAIEGGRTICAVCKLGIIEHFEAIEKTQMGHVESLLADIEVMDMTADIQNQAIAKQSEAIEKFFTENRRLNELLGEHNVQVQENFEIMEPEACPHPRTRYRNYGVAYCPHCLTELENTCPHTDWHTIGAGPPLCKECGKPVDN